MEQALRKGPVAPEMVAEGAKEGLLEKDQAASPGERKGRASR